MHVRRRAAAARLQAAGREQAEPLRAERSRASEPLKRVVLTTKMHK